MLKRSLFLFVGIICSFSGNSQALAFDTLGFTEPYCRLFPFQNGNGLVFCSATGGTPDYTYTWTNLGTAESTNSTTWGGLNPGCYEISVTDAAMETIKDTVCLDSINPVAVINATSTSMTPFTTGDGLYGFGYPVVQFNNWSTGFANPNNPLADTTFWWNFKYPTDVFQVSNSVYETFYYGYPEGSYDVQLVAQNKNGCTDTAMTTILVFPYLAIGDFTGHGLFSLTPDYDEHSISFELGGLKEADLRIYDASGRMVAQEFLSNESGTIEFSQPHGVYLYQLNSEGILTEPISGKFQF